MGGERKKEETCTGEEVGSSSYDGRSCRKLFTGVKNETRERVLLDKGKEVKRREREKREEGELGSIEKRRRETVEKDGERRRQRGKLRRLKTRETSEKSMGKSKRERKCIGWLEGDEAGMKGKRVAERDGEEARLVERWRARFG